MPKVAVVKMRYVAKNYWFSPQGLELEEGDHVVVETARGKEIGLVVEDLLEVPDQELKKPLKPVLRVATQEDLDQADEMNRKGEEAMSVFRECIEKHGLTMKPVRVEYMFTGDFATFYFAADDRVDFRALVRDLASQLRIRVDMRQIGPRDEARMLGGFGHCGEELCCCRMGGEFQPVGIRMAKEQDLPLNPVKISGACGRLMCCLRYEFEAYKDFKSRAPKKNALIDTPAGVGKVVEFDTPRERLRLRMEDGSSLVVPLGSMDTGDKPCKEGERVRPCHIGQEAFDKIIEDLHREANLAVMGDKLFSDDDSLADKVADRGHVERSGSGRGKRRIAMGSENVGGNSKSDGRRRRRGGDSSGRQQAEPQARDQRKRRRSVSVDSAESAAATDEHKPRQRRNAGGEQSAGNGNGGNRRRRSRGGRGNGSGSGSSNATSKQQDKPRPGQKSSTLHGPDGGQKQGAAPEGAEKPKRRRRRRGGRGRSNGGGNGANNGNNSAPSGGGASE